MQIKQVLYSELNDTLIVQYPIDQYEHKYLEDIYKAIKNAFPQGKILMIPDNITLSIFTRGDNFFI